MRALISSCGITPKVLVVDDCKTNLLVMRTMLKPMGLDVFSANSGRQAVSLASQHDFAVIILDVHMPDMGGLAVARLLQFDERTAHLPIIFVTANTGEEGAVFKAYEVGAVDYLSKPVDPMVLTSKVAVFCRLYRREKMLEKLLYDNEGVKSRLEDKNKELECLANSDTLTNLPNRFKFKRSIQRILSDSKRNKRVFALLFIDLDNFKSINDTHGHHVGDLMLRAIADKLKSCFRQGDACSRVKDAGFIARLGGDEFAVILTDLNDTNDAGVAAKRATQEVGGSYHLAGADITASVSVGIACYPFAGRDLASLYKNADSAMYSAKNAGKNSYQYYTDSLHQKHIAATL